MYLNILKLCPVCFDAYILACTSYNQPVPLFERNTFKPFPKYET